MRLWSSPAFPIPRAVFASLVGLFLAYRDARALKITQNLRGTGIAWWALLAPWAYLWARAARRLGDQYVKRWLRYALRYIDLCQPDGYGAVAIRPDWKSGLCHAGQRGSPGVRSLDREYVCRGPGFTAPGGVH